MLHLFRVSSDVSPDYVRPFRLKVPGGHKDNVVVADPHPSLYLASYPARPYLSVSALYYDIVAAHEFDHSAEKLAFLRRNQLFEF